MEIREIVGEEMTLLAEFNHRLFNTLQTIAAAVAQCRKDLRDRADMTCLVDFEDRLAALGQMHRLLSQPAPRAGLEDHCRLLCILLVRAFGREDVTPWVAMDDLHLSPIQAHSVPLLVVELVTNALKHSLVDQADGVVWVDLHVRGDHIELTVADNRKAPLPVFAPSRIVSTLAGMLHGEAFVCDSNGWIAGVRIPCKAPAAANAAWTDGPMCRRPGRASAALNARPDRRGDRHEAAETAAKAGDDGMNDLLDSQVVRTGDLQAGSWPNIWPAGHRGPREGSSRSGGKCPLGMNSHPRRNDRRALRRSILRPSTSDVATQDADPSEAIAVTETLNGLGRASQQQEATDEGDRGDGPGRWNSRDEARGAA